MLCCKQDLPVGALTGYRAGSLGLSGLRVLEFGVEVLKMLGRILTKISCPQVLLAQIENETNL